MNEFDEAVVTTLKAVDRTRPKLFTALAKAQREISAASKDSVNPHFKSRYADLAACWDACRDALTKNELSILQPVKADGPNVTITTILAHSSGESIEEALTMTAQANTPQAIGSVITYGRRYGLCAMVGIAPEEDDGEAAERPASVPEKPTAPPKSVVDVATGEQVPPSKRPKPPDGYRYIDRYRIDGQWHHVEFLKYRLNGEGASFKTKFAEVGILAAEAYEQGVPVRVTVKEAATPGDEGFLQKVDVWKGPDVESPF
jgi:hypothetical protein